MHKVTVIFSLIIFSFLCSLSSSQAATRTATSTGDWNTASTWDCNCVPSSTDDVVIDNGVTVSLNTSSTVTVASLIIEDSNNPTDVLDLSGTGTLEITNDLTVRNRATLNIDSDFTVWIGGDLVYENNGNVEVNGTGNLYVNGCVDKTSGNADLTKVIASTLNFCVAGNGGCAASEDSGESAGGCALLPITLVYFRAELNESQVELTWATASEEENAYFTIEKSFDGQDFEELSTIDGAGTTTAYLQYEFSDDSELASITYYRLKQTDFDGTFTYSKIIQVYQEKSGGYANLYPNPTQGNTFKVDGFNISSLIVEVYNTAGKRIAIQTSESEFNWGIEGEYKFAQASSGLYIVLIKTDQGIFKKKLLVK